MFKVVRGNPTPEELAAAIAVMQARAAAASAGRGGRSGPVSQWSDPVRVVPRAVPAPGPRSWATSYWPS
ncbi:acyl-CoA carboxylase subunit epsilon [Streptomyces sp. NBC_01803]|uniref:acyl-CoA carboxylase subunit epsilon n=1 Tax=Streptomyces sp. NBC_01803 TaxID=2975946 RepID=UPI002DDB704F|nr:acyl-CoA carboxylase subunit epsilon [Streptomyces sp. NBC_01803]WSA47660.1 acyl-CoA carboxylase subunit epsilon [Streptomyces sp. NBC_01803]